MTTASNPATLNTLRQSVRDLLNEFDAADGLAAYYALHHDPARTALFIHRDSSGQIGGFLARCQTGFDLFRPLVTLRVRGEGAIAPLLEEGLLAGRPYLLVLPSSLAERVLPGLAVGEVTRSRIYRLDPRRHRPEVNVMVTIRPDRDGNPRAEVRSGGEVVAAAGVNWRSPIFAELYVTVAPEQRERGWGRAVVNAVVAELLRSRITPLYSAAEDNDASQALAESAGFVDTGAREVVAQVSRS